MLLVVFHGFFTDGSCVHPACPSTRFAAFAVVLDLATSMQQRIDLANQFLKDGLVPATFQLVAVGRVQGEQTISRAELTAILTVLESKGSSLVISDSQFALNLTSLLQKGTSVESLFQRDNLDLIRKVENQDLSQIGLRKVTSHVDPAKIACPVERYCALGNSFVDR